MQQTAVSHEHNPEIVVELPDGRFSAPARRVSRAAARERVLVIAGSLSTRLAARAILEKEGYEVEVAASAQRTLASGSAAPAVVLVDGQLDELENFLGSCPPTIRVVAMRRAGEDVATALAARMTDSVEMPFRRDELLTAVGRCVRRV